MRVAIIGAGNVGGMLTSRIIDSGLADVTLIDLKEKLALAKAHDISDSLYLTKSSRKIHATSDFSHLGNYEIIVITAGFPRMPGMSREQLILKNAKLIEDIGIKVKPFVSNAIVIIVTNPLDLMTYYFKKVTQISSKRLIGMGGGLDASRFAQLISAKLGVDVEDIQPVVIGSHGAGMLPLARLTLVKGKPLAELAQAADIEEIISQTVERGAHIVSLYETGSAYFAPSAAIYEIVSAIINDEKRVSFASCYLQGEYDVNDVCLGVPVTLGKYGIEEIIDLNLDKKEKELFNQSAKSLKKLIKKLPPVKSGK